MLDEKIIIGMPTPRKMADMMKNIIIVLERVGMGCQAGIICCLNNSKADISSSLSLSFPSDFILDIVIVSWIIIMYV